MPAFKLPPVRSGRAAVATVEFAMLMPLLLLLFVVAVDFARIFYLSITLTNCAEAGALYGCADPVKANDTGGIKTAALKDATNVNPSAITVASATDSASTPTYVDVTVSCPFQSITGLIGVPQSITVSRKTRMKVSPWTPG